MQRRKRGETRKLRKTICAPSRYAKTLSRSSYRDTLLALAEVALDKQQWI